LVVGLAQHPEGVEGHEVQFERRGRKKLGKERFDLPALCVGKLQDKPRGLASPSRAQLYQMVENPVSAVRVQGGAGEKLKNNLPGTGSRFIRHTSIDGGLDEKPASMARGPAPLDDDLAQTFHMPDLTVAEGN